MFASAAVLILPVAAGFAGMSASMLLRAPVLSMTPLADVGAKTALAASSADAPPVKLIIPAIGVSAKIEEVGLTATGDLGIPSNFTDVAWYSGGPIPGNPGNAVIDGHLDGRYVPEAVFYKLGTLKAGDTVEVVNAQGTILDFRVTGAKTYAYDAATADVFKGDSTARLELITCAGDWLKDKRLYDKRIVVSAVLVSPQP